MYEVFVRTYVVVYGSCCQLQSRSIGKRSFIGLWFSFAPGFLGTLFT
uniref:Uncharacterized protein n=1 Tax=Zea mays TaxID=4577 RepID=B4FCP7_MAIZE|nr:unknown [Zea mays]